MVDFWQGKRVLVTGAHGFVGTHLCNALAKRNIDVLFTPKSSEYDLREKNNTSCLLAQWHPIEFDIVFNLAANVGGIGYNQLHPYSLFYDNIQIGINLIDVAIHHNVKKFIQVGTVCAYPKYAPTPFDERALWDGYPEETNAPYGIAKRVLHTQLMAARQEFDFNGVYVMPTNLYGEGDQFNPEQSHVIPALIKKFVEAKEQGLDEVEVWGSGSASRDFLYVKDAAEGLLLVAEKYDRPEPINLGSGNEINISVLVEFIKQIVGFRGTIRYDRSKPDGQPRRVLRTWKARDLGFKPQTSLKDGLEQTIEWYLANK